MELWPAIDIREGRCVRLSQGDFARETVYGDDPVKMAKYWCQLGARRLHLVDLDGARTGIPKNLLIVARIVERTGVVCQMGGGLRDREAIETALKTGVARVVIGTRAVKDPNWFREMCQLFPGRIVLGLDARNGLAATDGWLETTEQTAIDVARQFQKEPLAAIVYTDIASDGMLTGPNISAMTDLQRAVDVPVIASGGISTLQDIQALKNAGLAGCILGRALYEQKVFLPKALKLAGDEDISKK